MENRREQDGYGAPSNEHWHSVRSGHSVTKKTRAGEPALLLQPWNHAELLARSHFAAAKHFADRAYKMTR